MTTVRPSLEILVPTSSGRGEVSRKAVLQDMLFRIVF